MRRLRVLPPPLGFADLLGFAALLELAPNRLVEIPLCAGPPFDLCAALLSGLEAGGRGRFGVVRRVLLLISLTLCFKIFKLVCLA